MKKKLSSLFRALPPLQFFLLITSFSLVSCEKDTRPVPPVRPVKLLTLADPGISKVLSFPGVVKAFSEADLSFLVSGRIVEIPIKRGQQVKKGEVLARLDPRDYQNQFNAENAYVKERETYVTRMTKALSQGAATKMELEQAQRDLEVAKAKAAIAKKALDDTVLKAPFDGEIGLQYKEVFQDVASNEEIFRIQDVNKLKIVIDVPENVRIMVKNNESSSAPANSQLSADQSPPAFATFTDIPGKKFPLEVHEQEPAANPETRTYAVTFTMTPPKLGLIVPGMSATVTGEIRIKTPRGVSAFLVPVSAIFSGAGEKRFAWIRDPKTSQVHRREVTVGAMSGKSIEVYTGLKPGETIAISGVHYLRDGMKVRPMSDDKKDTQK